MGCEAMRTLLLFTRDLRVHDHPALRDAARSGEVVPLFVLNRRMLAASPNRSRLLVESLRDLDHSLRQRGAGLVIRRGDPALQAVLLAKQAGCDTLAVTNDFSATAERRERALEDRCRAAGIRLRVHPGHAIVEPGALPPAGRAHYAVFSPYHRAWLGQRRRAVRP